MKKKIYIGFTMDMDRAYHYKYSQLNKFYEKENFRLSYKKKYDEYILGTIKHIELFEKLGMGKSPLYLINETAYNQTSLFQRFLLNLKDNGDIGLHTHFNSTILNGIDNFISHNTNDYFEEGLIIPKQKLENLLDVKIDIFKSGVHMINERDIFYKDLFNSNIKYDCTPGINFFEPEYNIDFTDFNFGSLPKYIKGILTIPECIYVPKNGNSFKYITNHINNLPVNAPVLLRFQSHPFEYNENILDTIEYAMKELNNRYDVEYKGFYEMIDIFKKYQSDNINIKLVIFDIDNIIFKYKYENNKKILINENIPIVSNIIDFLLENNIYCVYYSLNDVDSEKQILENLGLWNDNIIPIIGKNVNIMNIQNIIEKFELNQDNILFISENYYLLEEVKFNLPKVYIEDDYFIYNIFKDGRFSNIKIRENIPNLDKSIITDLNYNNLPFLESTKIKCKIEKIKKYEDFENHILYFLSKNRVTNYSDININIDLIKNLVEDTDFFLVFMKLKYMNLGISGLLSIKNNKVKLFCFNTDILNSLIDIYLFNELKLEINNENLLHRINENKKVINWIDLNIIDSQSYYLKLDLNHITVYDTNNINLSIDNNIIIIKIKNIPSTSYGFYIYYTYPLKSKIETKEIKFKCKLKVNEIDIYPKIYTGIKWIELNDKCLNNEYQDFNIVCDINFFAISKWRLSTTSKLVDQEIYFKDLEIN